MAGWRTEHDDPQPHSWYAVIWVRCRESGPRRTRSLRGGRPRAGPPRAPPPCGRLLSLSPPASLALSQTCTAPCLRDLRPRVTGQVLSASTLTRRSGSEWRRPRHRRPPPEALVPSTRARTTRGPASPPALRRVLRRSPLDAPKPSPSAVRKPCTRPAATLYCSRCAPCVCSCEAPNTESALLHPHPYRLVSSRWQDCVFTSLPSQLRDYSSPLDHPV